MAKLRKIWDKLLTFLALAFLVAFSWPAFDSSPSESTTQFLEIIQWVSWVAFALDLVFSFILARNKREFVKKHPLDIIAVALPMLRPLRLIRVISFGSMVLDKVAIGKSLGILIRLFVVTFFFAYIAAVQITITERVNPDANIHNFADGLWWSFTTITTVGYGDKFPITGEGRILAVFLMVLGISLLGVITATFAAWFVKMMQQDEAAK